jgi:DNA-binding MarR family transcriptional regulator
LIERGAMTGSELAAITGLTTGAITGVVARLERAGYLRRAPDAHDRRKQVLSPVVDRLQEIDEVFAPFYSDIARLLEGFDARQLAAIADFLDHTTVCLLRHVVLLRAHAVAPRVSERSGAASTFAVAREGATQ